MAGPEKTSPEGRGGGAGTRRRISIATRVHDQLDAPVAAHATASELRRVLEGQRVAMVVFRPDDGEILLANAATAELSGRPLDEVIGAHALDLVEPEFKFELAAKSLATGAVDAYRARRRLRGHEEDVLYLWVRAIDVDGSRLGVAVAALGTDLVGLGGAGLGSPFGATVSVAAGAIDANWKILRVSADLKEITGLAPEEVRERSLLDLIAPEDASRVRDAEREGPSKPVALYSVQLREPSEAAPDFCLLVGEPGAANDGTRLFALVGWPLAIVTGRTARERDLELRLRRISAEVRAAGLIEVLGDHAGTEPRGLGDALTTRQLEIVEMLLRGVRVPTIARSLYISPSTVRNHLSTIYRRFNVHSQAELLEKLRETSASDG